MNKFEALNNTCTLKLSVDDCEFEKIQMFNKRRFFPYYGFIYFGSNIQYDSGIYMFSANDDPVAMNILYNKTYEPMTTRIWAYIVKLLNEKDTVVDCGAHTGFYSLVSASINPKLNVISFEPVIEIFERLKLNIRLNSFGHVITPIPSALGSLEGQVQLNIPIHKDGLLPTGSSSAGRNPVGNETLKREIHVTTLTHALRQKNIVPSSTKLIKVDAEGAELEVLRGFEELLKLHNPDLIIEILDTQAGNKVTEFLKKYNYQSAGINEKREILDPSIKLGNILYSKNLSQLLLAFSQA